MYSDDGNADRIGSLNWWSGGGAGEQDSRERNRRKTISKRAKGEDMGATHEQVNMMLHLYELRREAKLREAREWMSVNFHPTSGEDAMRLTPPGSKESAYMRMVLGYWEMVASIANRGLVDEELMFENSASEAACGNVEDDVCESTVSGKFGRALQAVGGMERKAKSGIR
jgi:hypothetical protein